MKLTKKMMALLMILAVVLGVAGVKWYKAAHVRTVDSVESRSKGAVNAKVKIVEFIDFECPACAYGVGELHKYLDKYPNDIHVQVKYFPLVMKHQHAMQSALYQECAARQGKFWDMLYAMMSSQAQWSPLINADGMFQDMAKQAGVDLNVLNACIASDDAKQTIEDEGMLGKSLSIQSTPTYFINNKMVVGGKSLIDELKTYFPDGV